LDAARRGMASASHQSFRAAATGTVVLLNGAFGVGKTTVARHFRTRVGGSRVYDPERVGYVLRRLPRWFPGSTAALDDYRDSVVWRAITRRCIRVLARVSRPLIVPMALDLALLDELRDALTARGCRVLHVCLVAPVQTVHQRLKRRGVTPTSDEGMWVYPRASAACRDHSSDAFARRIDAEGKDPDAIVDEIIALLADGAGR
jgi:predicted kinase